MAVRPTDAAVGDFQRILQVSTGEQTPASDYMGE